MTAPGVERRRHVYNAGVSAPLRDVLASALPILVLEEEDRGRADLLRSTLLKPESVLAGKLLASLWSGSAFLLYGLILEVPFVLLMPFSGSWSIPACFVLSFLAVAAVAATAGSLAAALSRTSTRALVLSYLLMALWLFLNPLSPIRFFSTLAFEGRVDEPAGPLMRCGSMTGLYLVAGLIQYGLAVAAFRRKWRGAA